MEPVEQFLNEVRNNIQGLREDTDLQALSRIWIREMTRYKYAYNFSWMGRPIIQLPQDMMAMQEIIWQVKPDLIIETGIAHGGSLIYYASLLELIGHADAYVFGIDIDLREHNRPEIEKHPMYHRIRMLEGSSISSEVIDNVHRQAEGKQRVLVVLDSNHTHDHVLQELNAYSSLVTQGSYLVVFDTIIEDMPDDLPHTQNRPWRKGNNPKTAVQEFLSHNDRFEPDTNLEAKLLITVAPQGYLKCIKD